MLPLLSYCMYCGAAAQQQFAEEVSLLLLSTLTKKKPVVELTRNYNEVFRGPATAGKLSPMTAAEMADTLSKLPGFSVSMYSLLCIVYTMLHVYSKTSLFYLCSAHMLFSYSK